MAPPDSSGPVTPRPSTLPDGGVAGTSASRPPSRVEILDRFPRERAETQAFRGGVPRAVRVARDHSQALFLRSEASDDPVMNLWRLDLAEGRPNTPGAGESELAHAKTLASDDLDSLPAAERARRERLREAGSGITDYSCDAEQSKVCFVVTGSLWLLDLAAGNSALLVEAGVTSPTMDPTGAWIAFNHGGGLHLVAATTTADPPRRTLCSDESPDVTWGQAEFLAAEEMGRYRGFWWAPDGDQLLVTRVDEAPVDQWALGDPANPDQPVRTMRYPAAGSTNADVQLHVVSLAGTITPVTWDRSGYEYLASVRWSKWGSPLVCVQPRDQSCVLTLSVDPDTGATSQMSRRTEAAWADLVPGVPIWTASGIVDTAIDEASDTRSLVLGPDHKRLTPPGLQIRAVVAADESAITVLASSDTIGQGFYTVALPSGDSNANPASQDIEPTLLSEPGGWSVGSGSAGAYAVSRADPHDPRTRVTVTANGQTTQIVSLAATSAVRPKPTYFAANEVGLDTAVLWPTDYDGHSPLPVIMSPYGGPHAQRVIDAASAYLTEQWMADHGFCVLVADGPGTPRTPSFERAVQGDLVTGPLQGQIAALQAAIARYPGQLDPNNVGIRGWSFGGYLAALAILERPDVFKAAVAGAPVTQWTLYDTHYTERYLGNPEDQPEAYRASDLTLRAHALSGELLIVHGLNDDNVFAAHTLRLSSALLAAGKAHTVLPLTGVSHMTPQAVVAQNLLRLDLQFLQKALQPRPMPGRRTGEAGEARSR